MNYYGNILTIYGPNETNIPVVLNTLQARPDTVFQQHENTFYIGTLTKADARNLANMINSLGFSYSFIHLAIPTGSYFQSSGIPADIEAKINNILFED